MTRIPETADPERREYFSRLDIEDMMKRTLPIYQPDAWVEWASDCSAVVVWQEVANAESDGE